MDCQIARRRTPPQAQFLIEEIAAGVREDVAGTRARASAAEARRLDERDANARGSKRVRGSRSRQPPADDDDGQLGRLGQTGMCAGQRRAVRRPTGTRRTRWLGVTARAFSRIAEVFTKRCGIAWVRRGSRAFIVPFARTASHCLRRPSPAESAPRLERGAGGSVYVVVRAR